jgi:hypothetical protein
LNIPRLFACGRTPFFHLGFGITRNSCKLADKSAARNSRTGQSFFFVCHGVAPYTEA